MVSVPSGLQIAIAYIVRISTMASLRALQFTKRKFINIIIAYNQITKHIHCNF